MSWFIFTLLSITSLAVAELIQQKILRSKENEIDERSSTVLTYFFPIILVLIFILFTRHRAELFSVFDQGVFSYLLLASFTASLGVFFYLKSFNAKNICFSLVFMSFSAVVSTILGIIFLNESFYITKFIGVGLILSSLVFLNFKSAVIEKYHWYGLVAGVFFGISYIMDKLVVIDTSPVTYLFWSFTLVTLGTFFLNPRAVIETIKVTKIAEYKPLMISGLGFMFFNLFTFTAYTYGGEVGRVDAINNTEIFLVILAEYFIFKQKKDIKIKLITALIAIVGVCLLGAY